MASVMTQPTASSSKLPDVSSTTSPARTTLTLDAAALQSFRPSKIFKAPTYIASPHSYFTSLDFDDKGELCVSASDDETIQLWNVKTGRHAKTLYSKKYGVHMVRFTHRSSTVIYASTKGDDTIRYHSLHDNKYLTYFRGHTARVCSLEMNPVNDTFLSGAVGDSIKLWDLRSPNAQGSMPVKGHPTVAFDPSGEVLALGISERMTVLLYARNSFNAPPFMSIEIEDSQYLSRVSMPPRQAVLTSLQFSPAASSGHLLVGTAGDQHYVLDTWENNYKWRLVGHDGLEKATAIANSDAASSTTEGAGPSPSMIPEAALSGEELCWSPDGKFVLAGSASGTIFVWQIPGHGQPPAPGSDIALMPVAKLEGHTGPVRAIAFNRKAAGECVMRLSVAKYRHVLMSVIRPSSTLQYSPREAMLHRSGCRPPLMPRQHDLD